MTGDPRLEIVQFSAVQELYAAAADRIVSTATQAIDARGRFVLAVSGGRTPIPVYERLAAFPDRLDGTAIDVFWADERLVPSSDVLSNAKAVRDAWLDRVPVPSARIHPIDGTLEPLAAADAYELAVREILGNDGRFDLVVLGIGADGHTASLFPRHQALTERDRWVVPVHTPAAPPWRVTLTLPAINAARRVLFLAVGREKAEAVRALAAGEPVPAGQVRLSTGGVALLVDDAAAALVPIDPPDDPPPPRLARSVRRSRGSGNPR